ncbi:hypothetical protein Tco_0294614 [Tanacetum coccineum]
MEGRQTLSNMKLSRMYALESQKNISVALKLSNDDLLCSFRRAPRAGAEELQYIQLVKIMEGFTLFDSKDRWRWSLEGCGKFTIVSVRNLLDANSLPVVSSKTRWIQAVPIKVNIYALNVNDGFLYDEWVKMVVEYPSSF